MEEKHNTMATHYNDRVKRDEEIIKQAKCKTVRELAHEFDLCENSIKKILDRACVNSVPEPRKEYKIDQNIIDRAVDLYSHGYTNQETATLLNCAPSTVWNIVKSLPPDIQAEVETNHKEARKIQKYNTPLCIDICYDAEHMTLAELETKYNRSTYTIRKILKAHRITAKRAKRKKKGLR